jgi:hypothetical protein
MSNRVDVPTDAFVRELRLLCGMQECTLNRAFVSLPSDNRGLSDLQPGQLLICLHTNSQAWRDAGP